MASTLLLTSNISSSTYDDIKTALDNTKIDAQLRTGHYSTSFDSTEDTYGTSLGGKFLFETGSYKGMNIGGGFYTSHNINFLSGEGIHEDHTLSSDNGY